MPKRRPELIEKRDKAIFKRYLYWSEHQRLRFDDTMKRLSEEEFFLTENILLTIIRREMARAESEGEHIPRQRYLSVML